MIGFGAISAKASPQDMVVGYGMAVGGIGQDYIRGITTDADGNVYAIGGFEGTVDFDPGPGTLLLTSAGGLDVFVSKLDSTGALQWVRTVGGNDDDRGTQVAIDSAGNIIGTGWFSAMVDFDPGPGVFNLTSAGDIDSFVWKLDAAGALVWAVGIGGSAAGDLGYDIAVGNGGEVYYTGAFAGTVDFDPGPGTFNLVSAGLFDIFTCKLDATGVLQWANATGGTSTDIGYGIDVDGAGDVYNTGFFEGMVDFDPGPGELQLTGAGGEDIFVCKFDAAGSLQWARSMGGGGNDSGYEIALGGIGEIYFTGWFESTSDLDPGPGVFSLTSAGQRDSFICRLDNSGIFQWASAVGGSGNDYSFGVAVDSGGAVYGSGRFEGTSDFDPGPSLFNLTSAGISDGFVVKLDTSGNLLWAGAIGGSSPNLDSSASVTIDKWDSAYLTGYFEDSADFDPGPGILEIDSLGTRDAFIVKLEPQLLPVATSDAGETDADQLLTSLVSPTSSTSLLANDTDANTRYTLTVSAYDTISVLGAAVLVNPDGTFVYDPTTVPAFQALAPGESLVDTFTYTLSDGTDTDVGTVTITVYGAGTTMPAVGLWSVLLLGIGLAGAGVRAVRSHP